MDMNILIVSDIRNISKMKVEKRIEMKKKQWTVVGVLFFHKNSNSKHFDANDWNCYPNPILYPIFRFRRMPYIQHLVQCVMQ